MHLTTRSTAACSSSSIPRSRNWSAGRPAWFARRADFSKGLAPAIAAYRGGITDYARSLQSNLSATERARLAADEQRYATAGVPPSLAIAIASLGPLGESTDVVETALASGSEVVAVSSVHAAVGAEFRFDELIERSSRCRPRTATTARRSTACAR